MKRIFILFLAMALAPGLTALDPVRMALVVGNSAYTGPAWLKNPANDAADMASALRKVGWTVSLVTDVDRRGFLRALSAFREALASQEGADALFYFAGHGMQLDGINYLLPVKTSFDTPDDVRNDAVGVPAVVGAIREGKAKVSVVILDACRDNPFAKETSRSQGRTRGLTLVPSAGGSIGSVLMFSTSPGDVAADGPGRNGVFTGVLVKHLGAGIKVEDLFRRVTGEVRALTAGGQSPWINASLAEDFYLGPLPAQVSGTTGSRSPGVPEGYAVLRFDTDPPGIMVSVDGEDPQEAPFQKTLTPGVHSFEVLASYAGLDRFRFYDAEPKQWITVVEGSEGTIPLKPHRSPGGRLLFPLVPRGALVFVDGELRATATMAGGVDVESGRHELRVELPWGRVVNQSVVVPPGQSEVVPWGTSTDRPVILARQTINLDNLGSWGGVSPVFQGTGRTFRGNPSYGIKAGYVCRDDRYLYWRVDFNELNPVKEPPAGYTGSLSLAFNMTLPADPGTYKLVSLLVSLSSRMTQPAAGINQPNNWVNLGTNRLEFRSMKSTLVGRYPIETVQPYFPEIHTLNFDLWSGTSDATPWVYCDLTR